MANTKNHIQILTRLTVQDYEDLTRFLPILKAQGKIDEESKFAVARFALMQLLSALKKTYPQIIAPKVGDQPKESTRT